MNKRYINRSNQAGDAVFEDHLMFGDDIRDEEIKDVLLLVLAHLKLDLVRTNATKHGNTELQLRPEE